MTIMTSHALPTSKEHARYTAGWTFALARLVPRLDILVAQAAGDYSNIIADFVPGAIEELDGESPEYVDGAIECVVARMAWHERQKEESEGALGPPACTPEVTS